MENLKLYLSLGYRYWFYTLLSHCKLVPLDFRIVAEMKCIAMLMERARVKFGINLEGDT